VVGGDGEDEDGVGRGDEVEDEVVLKALLSERVTEESGTYQSDHCCI